MTERDEQLLARIHQLTAGQLEGALTEEQRAALDELLASDAGARRLYVEYMQDTASLRWISSGHYERHVVEPASVAAGSWASLRARGARPWAWAAAAALVVATASWRIGERIRAEDRAKMAAARVAAEATQPPARTSSPVATLTGVSSVEWAGITTAPSLLSRVAVGERLDITAGTIELTFDTGAQVKVFGPAKIEISSPRSILCSLGRVTTLVGKSGRGFTIDTPKARIVDLGTQFGVNISERGDTQIVVFQGSVDLERSAARAAADGAAEPGASAMAANKWRRRMRQGDALLLDDTGEAQRVMAVQRGDFFPSASARAYGSRQRLPVIEDVHDNIRAGESTKCYQIVHGGLREDAPAFVDRSHQWNGVTDAGLPEFLLDADYIMPFNDDKFVSDLEVSVKIARPATCYVFLDKNMAPPAWLKKSFKDTGFDIGLDGAKTVWHKKHKTGEGPGANIDFVFSVWAREIDRPGVVTFGGVKAPKIGERSSGFNMYGIAVVPKKGAIRTYEESLQ
jgi:hypothetical protein